MKSYLTNAAFAYRIISVSNDCLVCMVCRPTVILNKKAVLSQGNRATQHVFPTPYDSSIVICFSLPKAKAVSTDSYLSTKSSLYVKLQINK